MTEEQKKNILIVEDETLNPMPWSLFMAAFGYNVVRARAGEEALKCLVKQNFDLIFMEAKMQAINSRKTEEMIKKTARESQTPIIFFAGYDQIAIPRLVKNC